MESYAQGIWRDLEVSETAQKQQLDEITERALTVWNTAVEHAEQHKQTVRARIDEAAREICKIAEQLGEHAEIESRASMVRCCLVCSTIEPCPGCPRSWWWASPFETVYNTVVEFSLFVVRCSAVKTGQVTILVTFRYVHRVILDSVPTVNSSLTIQTHGFLLLRYSECYFEDNWQYFPQCR